MGPNDSTTASTIQGTNNFWVIDGNATYNNESVKVYVDKSKGISPVIYFKFLKKKFKLLEKVKLDGRLKRLEKAFYKAIDNGQEALGEKFLREISRETRESILWANGYKLFVEEEDVRKHKHSIYDGHISDTSYESFTRVIPEEVIKKKKAADPYFDNFIILHYWNEKAQKDTERMDPDEKAKMRDPILFGRIKETSRWYFIADWEDDKCDLTFDKLIDFMGKDEKDISLSANPILEKE